MNCPECDGPIEFSTVDVGVGSIQCGPAICLTCNWTEPDPEPDFLGEETYGETSD